MHLKYINNTATSVPCFHSGYTLVENFKPLFANTEKEAQLIIQTIQILCGNIIIDLDLKYRNKNRYNLTISKYYIFKEITIISLN